MSIGEHFHHGLGWTCESVDERLKSLESQNESLRRELNSAVELGTKTQAALIKACEERDAWKAQAEALKVALQADVVCFKELQKLSGTDLTHSLMQVCIEKAEAAIAAFKEPK